MGVPESHPIIDSSDVIDGCSIINHPCSGTPIYGNPHRTIVGWVISQLTTSRHRAVVTHQRTVIVHKLWEFLARPPAKNVHHICRCYQGVPGH